MDLISVNDFVDFLKKENLIIVNQSELELGKEMKKQQLLKRKDLSFSEILDAGFFRCKDAETLRRWCINGKFGENGYHQLPNGQYRILSIAIKKILYGK